MTTAEKSIQLSNFDTLIKEKSYAVSSMLAELAIIREQRMNFIFNNHLYVTDLSEFEGKDISSISIFNSSGENIDVPLDEIVEVIDGKLYCSSYQGGIVEFVEGKYSHTFRFTTIELDIIGFYDIKVRDD